MSEKEYLTEETYKKGKHTFTLIGAIILVLGLTIGTALIILGITKIPKADAGLIHFDLVAVEDTSSDTSFESRVSEMRDQYDAEQEKMQAKFDSYAEQSEAEQETTGQHYLDNFNTFKQQSEDEFNAISRQAKDGFTSTLLIMGGVFVILSSIMISVPFFVIAHRREILAFGTQQVLPVAKEATEKVTPTAAKAAGTVAESVAEGITRGVKKAKSDSEK